MCNLNMDTHSGFLCIQKADILLEEEEQILSMLFIFDISISF